MNPSKPDGTWQGAVEAKAGDQEPDVVVGTAEDGMDGVAKRALERGAGEPVIHLHVPDGGHDGASAPDHGLERAGDAAPLAGSEDAHARDLDAAEDPSR